MATNGAAIIGYAGFGFLADVYGRKPITMAYFALAFLSVPIFFIWTQDLTLLLWAGAFSGIFVSGQFTWMSAWLPELFPTRMRATATAFVFNAAALIFMDRSADFGLADREFRRLQPSRGGDRDRLYSRPRGGPFPAGDARKAAAGVELRQREDNFAVSASL